MRTVLVSSILLSDGNLNCYELTAAPRFLLPAGSTRSAVTSAIIRSCSALCADAYPSAGLARSGRPMYRTIMTFPVDTRSRGDTYVHAPMFFGSSCAHTTSVALG